MRTSPFMRRKYLNTDSFMGEKKKINNAAAHPKCPSKPGHILTSSTVRSFVFLMLCLNISWAVSMTKLLPCDGIIRYWHKPFHAWKCDTLPAEWANSFISLLMRCHFILGVFRVEFAWSPCGTVQEHVYETNWEPGNEETTGLFPSMWPCDKLVTWPGCHGCNPSSARRELGWVPSPAHRPGEASRLKKKHNIIQQNNHSATGTITHSMHRTLDHQPTKALFLQAHYKSYGVVSYYGKLSY